MERIRLSDTDINTAAAWAAATLRAGGIVLYPTDTLYGLAADAGNSEALRRLRQLKGREEGKTFSVAVADMPMMARYALVTPLAARLAAAYLPGALTLVLDAAETRPDQIMRGDGTVAVRIPDHPFCLALAREFGAYTATSANLAGKEALRNVDDILAQLASSSIEADLAIDAGELPASAGSTIVDARADAPVILRAGALTISDTSGL
jgi:L-threonylcarbamoyladenylate synthase